MIPSIDPDLLSNAIYNVYKYLNNAVRDSVIDNDLPIKLPGNHYMLLILKNCIKFNVFHTQTPEEILRVNTIATKLIWSSYKLWGGIPFLHKFCRPLVAMILSKKKREFPINIL